MRPGRRTARSQLPAQARPHGQQGFQAQAPGIGLQADALQRADGIAERQHVGRLRAVGAQRAHDQQDGAAGIAALGRLGQIGQHAGLGQIAAGRLRRAARRVPQRDRHVDVERVEHRRQPMQRLRQLRRPRRRELLDQAQARQAPALPLRIGDVDQRQPMLRPAIRPPSAGRVELARRQSDLHRHLAETVRVRTGPQVVEQRRQHARGLHGGRRAPRIVEQHA